MSEKNHFFESKWGEQSLVLGWTGVPTSLFLLQKSLSITPNMLNVLLNLIIHWWKAGEWPHPSQETIANRMGVSVRTVQRALDELETAGLLVKVKTSRDHPKYRGRNLYDLSGLLKALEHQTPVLKSKLDKGSDNERYVQ